MARKRTIVDEQPANDRYCDPTDLWEELKFDLAHARVDFSTMREAQIESLLIRRPWPILRALYHWPLPLDNYKVYRQVRFNGRAGIADFIISYPDGFAIVELKRDRADGKALLQLLRYMGAACRSGTDPLGFLVARKIDDDVRLQCSALPNVRTIELNGVVARDLECLVPVRQCDSSCPLCSTTQIGANAN